MQRSLQPMPIMIWNAPMRCTDPLWHMAAHGRWSLRRAANRGGHWLRAAFAIVLQLKSWFIRPR